MISLKRDAQGRLVPATGRRTTEKSSYKPNQTEDFKVSSNMLAIDTEADFFLENESINVPLLTSLNISPLTICRLNPHEYNISPSSDSPSLILSTF